MKNNSKENLEISKISANQNNEKFLKTNATDYIVSVLKGLLGIIPYAGSAAGEVVSWTIPNQRIDRISKYIEYIAKRIVKLENTQKEWLEKLKNSKNNLLLFELATKYSMETNSDILHHSYAYLVFDSIENKNLDDSRNEKLLRTLSELTEDEIIHLINFSQDKALFSSSEFDKKYEDIIMPKSRTDHIPENEIHNAFRNEYILTLEQKGLITIIKRLDGNYPINTKDVRITDYGYLLVEAIYDEDFFGKINNR